MACGHCRRRKIRCIPPVVEDAQGRCANCIRLKKECIFFPVDHQTDAKSGREDIDTINSPSSSASQTPVSGHAMSAPQIGSAQQATAREHASSAAYPVSRAQESVPTEISVSQANYDYQGSTDDTQWIPPQEAGADQIHSPYWTSEQSTPIHPHFPRFDPSAGQPGSLNYYAGQGANLNQLGQWPANTGAVGQYNDPQLHQQARFSQYAGMASPGFQGDHSGYLTPQTTFLPMAHDSHYTHEPALLSPSHVLPSNDSYEQQQPPQLGPGAVMTNAEWFGGTTQGTDYESQGETSGLDPATMQHYQKFTSHPG